VCEGQVCTFVRSYHPVARCICSCAGKQASRTVTQLLVLGAIPTCEMVSMLLQAFIKIVVHWILSFTQAG
jgi:hypothetical protein